jgi:hypothetical protein
LSALDDLQAVMFQWKDRVSMIKPTLHRRANGPNYWYRLQLVEDFGSADDAGNYVPSKKLDECVNWVDEKLKEWPNCSRKAWDMWDFKSRREAEKFIILFHLSWAE